MIKLYNYGKYLPFPQYVILDKQRTQPAEICVLL